MLKIIKAKINIQEDEVMEDIVRYTQDRMIEYAKKHPDFTCVIEKHVDDGYITVKTLKLEENAN